MSLHFMCITGKTGIFPDFQNMLDNGRIKELKKYEDKQEKEKKIERYMTLM